MSEGLLWVYDIGIVLILSSCKQEVQTKSLFRVVQVCELQAQMHQYEFTGAVYANDHKKVKAKPSSIDPKNRLQYE